MHKDLLEQAIKLAKLDAKKPKQANLRRAISSAYYAMFHLLVDEACRVQIGAQHNQAPFRQVLGRAFAHGVMKEACKSFGGGTLKKGVAKGLPAAFTIPAEIRESGGDLRRSPGEAAPRRLRPDRTIQSIRCA